MDSKKFGKWTHLPITASLFLWPHSDRGSDDGAELLTGGGWGGVGGGPCDSASLHLSPSLANLLSWAPISQLWLVKTLVKTQWGQMHLFVQTQGMFL